MYHTDCGESILNTLNAVARTLCPRNIRVLTIPDAAPAAAAGQALASQYPQLLYGTITAHGPHRR